jgi:hypothetical protein
MADKKISGNFVAFGLAMVILDRTLKMYQNNSRHWFRVYTIVISAIISLGSLCSSICIPFVFSYGVQYTISPAYKYYIISGGLLMNVPLAIHMPISAFMFLYQIYSVRGFTILSFLKEWFLKQDGFRYIIILALNTFSLYCYVISAVYGQNDTTILSNKS